MEKNYYGELSIIGMKGSEKFLENVDWYLHQWRKDKEGTFLVNADCPRFGSGEGKGIIHETMRGHDTYIFADVFNYGVTYKMYGMNVPMSPDDHYQDLKRIICAIGGKARRVSVIMPMLYEGRQHRRTSRESLDCAMALQELVSMGVSNIITFDAHDSRVQQAIPQSGFDNVRPSYQMLKALVREFPDITFDKDTLMIVSPDEGAMSRSMYYSSVLGLELGMFYKRRNYTIVIDGRNPIEAHEFLGRSVEGKDIIVVDDMIATGESTLDIAEQLKEKGARRVFIFATFGLFTAGCDKIDAAYEKGLLDKIFTTNLNYRPQSIIDRPWYAEVNMCKYVSYIIDTLNSDSSISDLLNPVGRIHALVDRVQAANNGELR
ncbi:MAG: phosphoribosylpyrophosphate synthetase [Clostridiales bacterium]|nr:MAG: phosphoribosylpyrophosphate synthetase [Clostridiales bacterium]